MSVGGDGVGVSVCVYVCVVVGGGGEGSALMEPLGVLHYSYCQHCTAENLLHTTVQSHRNADDKYIHVRTRMRGGGGGGKSES